MNQELTPAQQWKILLPQLAPYLPAQLFSQLAKLPSDFEQADRQEQRRIGREMVGAVRALEPLHRTLMQYMPRYLLDLDPTPGQPHGQMLEGAYLFADVTGFTALTELLSRHAAARGREAMNEIMNWLFAAILDPLTASGGDLLIFAGDAVLAHFPKQDKAKDVLQATRAALRMQRAVAPFASFETEYGPCSLTISVGVERGVAYAAVVGSKERMELLVSGPGIHGATHAEERGESGQVILGEQAQALVAGHFRLAGPVVLDDLGETLGDYEVPQLRRKSGGSVFLSMDPAEVLTGLAGALQRLKRLTPFLPEDMLAQLINTDRHRRLESALRPVAVQFINLVGIEDLAVSHGPELATAVFQRYFVLGQKIISQHEGVISQIDAYSKGFFLLNTFGVPKIHEGTRLYAVSAALQLAKVLEQVNEEFALDPPLRQRGGITYGLIFSGEIGAQYRRESFVGGPAVNRAARLMSKADFGQVILDSDIWTQVQDAFIGERLPPVNLKGIDGPVVIVNVRDIRRSTRLQAPDRPLIGRAAEQARLGQLLTGSSGGIWLVRGESGLGKSALMADLAGRGRKQGFTVLSGRGQPHGKHIPLFAWVDALIGWLDVAERADLSQQRSRLESELASLAMSDMAGTLANVLGLVTVKTGGGAVGGSGAGQGSLLATLNQKLAEQEPSGPAATGMQGLLQQRLAGPAASTGAMWSTLKARVNGPEAVLALLQNLARREPLLIILEDIDWLDEASIGLVRRLVEVSQTGPLRLVMTGRAGLAEAQIDTLPLSPLTDQALSEIVAQKLGGSGLQDMLAVWINTQAGGNPLYALELAQALQQAEAVFLDRSTGEIRWTGLIPALPLSLRELLLARFDELTLAEQTVLKWGAVIGSSFDLAALLALSGKRLELSEIRLALAGAGQASFISFSGDESYRFTHPLMHETIYETLAFAQRQSWHTQLGDWLVAARPTSPLELKAHHYLRGGDVAKAVEFGLAVGDRARQLGVYVGAVDYYEQVLALTGLSPETERQVSERLADVLALQADYTAAKTLYLQAGELGSATAREKFALLTADLSTLRQTPFSPAQSLWAAGAKAWLLAQAGQIELALAELQQSLTEAAVPPPLALKQLGQQLQSGQPVADYEVWLGAFVDQVLAGPPA